jgi:hypothetical protein
VCDVRNKQFQDFSTVSFEKTLGNIGILWLVYIGYIVWSDKKFNVM